MPTVLYIGIWVKILREKAWVIKKYTSKKKYVRKVPINTESTEKR